MRELNIHEIRSIQLKILRDVANFCDKNNITYFLCGGTLLGAIRHKDYIPWDDDIDIMLPRPDYERLIKEYYSETLILCAFKHMSGYYYPYVKIMDSRTVLKESNLSDIEFGVNIDALPIDGFPDNVKELEKHFNRMKLLRMLFFFRTVSINPNWSLSKKFIAPVLKLISSLMPRKVIIDKIIKQAKKNDFSTSTKAGISVWGYLEREVCPSSVFNSGVEVEFAGFNFNAPKDYHIYLETVYGNYMELPPIDERVSGHNFKAYIK